MTRYFEIRGKHKVDLSEQDDLFLPAVTNFSGTYQMCPTCGNILMPRDGGYPEKLYIEDGELWPDLLSSRRFQIGDTFSERAVEHLREAGCFENMHVHKVEITRREKLMPLPPNAIAPQYFTWYPKGSVKGRWEPDPNESDVQRCNCGRVRNGWELSTGRSYVIDWDTHTGESIVAVDTYIAGSPIGPSESFVVSEHARDTWLENGLIGAEFHLVD